MDFETDSRPLIQESRIISTLITGKPSSMAFAVSTSTVLAMTLFSQFYWQDPLGWSVYLPAVRSDVFEGLEIWRILTAIFIHADFGHLASNMYMLSIFSFFITSYFGLSVFPLMALFFASLVNLIAISTYPPEVRLLGASGLVYLLGGFWLTMYFLIQRQYKVFNRSIRVIGVGLAVFFPTTFVPTTSYRTHAIGMALGMTMAFIYFYKNKKQIRSYEVHKISYVEALDS